MKINENQRTYNIEINENERLVLIQALSTFPNNPTAATMRNVLKGMDIP